MQRTTNQTLAIRNWSGLQKRCIAAIDNFPGMHLIVEGYPGTRKNEDVFLVRGRKSSCSTLAGGVGLLGIR
jgi:hypothetical protein